MTMLSILANNKTHIIYGAVILSVLGVGYNLLHSNPKEIIKTQVVTKVVTEVVTKEVVKNVIIHDNIVTKKVIETKKPDGTDTIETDTSSDTSISDSTTKSDTTDTLHESVKVTTKEVEKFLSTYTLSVMYPLTIKDISNPVFNPLDLQVTGGIRVFNLPIFLNVGTNVRLNTILVGFTLEF